MSKRGHWWWGAIQAALRLYPELRQRYGTPDNRLTAQYTAQTSCGGAGRVVELGVSYGQYKARGGI